MALRQHRYLVCCMASSALLSSCGDTLIQSRRSDAPMTYQNGPGSQVAPVPPQYGLTHLRLTQENRVRDIRPFGINLGNDDFWDSILLKNRIKVGGFEGIVYRQIARGPGGDARSFVDWNDLDPRDLPEENDISRRTWIDIAKGAEARVLAGDRRWRKDRIIDVRHETVTHDSETRPRLRFIFESEGPVVGRSGSVRLNEVGMLIEKTESTGFIGQVWVRSTKGAGISTVQNDIPPESTGQSVASLVAPAGEEARLVFPLTHNPKVESAAGTWQISLWAKGNGSLDIGLGGWDNRQVRRLVVLTNSWQKINLALSAEKTLEMFNLHIAISGGAALIDDVSAYRDGDSNPTSFRDPVVAALKRLKPGSLRNVPHNGSRFIDALKLPHERPAFGFQRNLRAPTGTRWPAHPERNGEVHIPSYGIHELLELCKEVGSAPWYSTSGTLYPEEMEQLVEYLAAPPTTPFGKLRAKRGQVEPWTQVFDIIHLELGNEAWNWSPGFAYGGWNGPEYWSLLIETARKALKKYLKDDSRVRFHIGGQNFNTYLGTEILQNHARAADGYAIAPYALHDLTQAESQLTPVELLNYAFGWVWHVDTGAPMMDVAKMVANSPKPEIEISVYEVNHHTTGGDAPLETRNTLVASLGGALNVINHMLLMLERQQVRVQNFYNFIQSEYNKVKLWGSVLSLEKGEERYRPTYLALMLANQVLSGDLVRVERSGEDPMFRTQFLYDGKNVDQKVPYLHVYATHHHGERGLILLNLHARAALPLHLELPKPVAQNLAHQWLLTANHIAANNEFPHLAEVAVIEQDLKDFNTDNSLEIPAHSMLVLKWKDAS